MHKVAWLDKKWVLIINILTKFHVTNKTIFLSTSFHSPYKKAIAWMVFPRPISSARMVFVPWDHENLSQFSPSSWYGCSLPPLTPRYSGCSSSFFRRWDFLGASNRFDSRSSFCFCFLCSNQTCQHKFFQLYTYTVAMCISQWSRQDLFVKPLSREHRSQWCCRINETIKYKWTYKSAAWWYNR